MSNPLGQVYERHPQRHPRPPPPPQPDRELCLRCSFVGRITGTVIRCRSCGVLPKARSSPWLQTRRAWDACLPGLSGHTQCGLRTVAQKDTPHAARAMRVHVLTMWPSYGGPKGHSTRCQGYEGTCTHNVAFVRWPKRALHTLPGLSGYMYSQCGLRTVAQKVTPHAARAMRVHVHTMWPSYGGPNGHSTRCQGYEGTCTHNVAFVRWPKWTLHTLPGL